MFNQFDGEHDGRVEKPSCLRHSGLPAMKQAVLQNRKGIEIGVGSERFAGPQHVEWVVELLAGIALLARQRSINAFNAVAETLALEIQPYDLAKMVTTGCFLNDIPKALWEGYLIIKPGGIFVIGLIVCNSERGKKYEQHKGTNKVYREAHFQ